VRFKPELRLLDDLDPILGRVDSFLRGFNNVPATFDGARRNIDDAIYECCENPDAFRFSALVRALGRLERLIVQRDRS
jgi:CRISPR-associated protein Csx17